MSSLQRSEYKHNLEGIIVGLRAIAGRDDVASIQINTDGVCILRQGVHEGEHLTVEQFAERMAESLSRELDSDADSEFIYRPLRE